MSVWNVVVYRIIVRYAKRSTASTRSAHGAYIVCVCDVVATAIDRIQANPINCCYSLPYRFIWSKNEANPRSVAKDTTYTTTGYFSSNPAPTKMQLVNFYAFCEAIKNILSIMISDSNNLSKERVKWTIFE
jgi:hypothetical protein